MILTHKKQLRQLKDFDINGKTILYRSPYDIGAKEVDGEFVIKDDSRIVATLPTLNYLLEQNCKIVIITYVKRPEGYDPSMSTAPHAIALSKLLDHPVKHISDCIGEKRKEAISKMQPKDILMLENVRFYAEEDEADVDFAKRLTEDCDFIVFDGFPQAHRVNASTTGILEYLPSCAGFYFESEYTALHNLLDKYKHPFTLVIGGAKVSDKTEAIYNLYSSVDEILVGGGPANVFLSARGIDMSASLTENFQIDETKIEKIKVPDDLVIGNGLENPTESEIFSTQSSIVPSGWAALDIGPETANEYAEIIKKSKTVFWAGPMGMFENDLFAGGSKVIAQAMCETSAQTIVGGGDTIEALNKFGDTSKIDHVSLAGGATLDFLAGKTLAVIELLQGDNKIASQ